MLNIEKYWNKLTEMKALNLKDFGLINGELVECNFKNCPYCEFKNKHHNCDAKVKKWLFDKYKEPEIDWSKVKVDTPILVKEPEYSNKWFKRYFAKYEDGKIFVWDNGTTSWTASGKDSICSWKYAKLAENIENKHVCKLCGRPMRDDDKASVCDKCASEYEI